jgi:alkaline phosphatase
MKSKSLSIFAVFLAVTILSFSSERQKPKNLIFFIGDGMGVTQVYAAMTVAGFEMTFPSFPVTGFSMTYSKNKYVTDSGAGGTALATGEKTNNYMISVRPDSTNLKTLFEYAVEKGMSTGIVCTKSLTDATPAAFVSHVPSRFSNRSIAKQYLNGAADIFIGGGRDFFEAEKDSSGVPDESTDYVHALKAEGYDVVYNLADFISSGADKIVGLMSENHMPKILQGRDPEYLAKATAKAIEVLSKNRKGFILMVEGSEIDDGGHAGDSKMVTDEVLDMDRAVKVAYDFASRDGKTLIVITADHETGGMSLPNGNLEERQIRANFGTGDHTGVMVPVFAYGPGASAFSGIQDNTELFRDFCSLLSIGL